MTFTRRRLLTRTLAGVTVLAVGGVVWRAWDNGVFSVGRGPPYEPWHTWRSEPAEGPLGLVQAAILAANAHNTQPWRFRVTAERIELYADLKRHLGSFDPYRREMYLSLGCALENMLLAAPAQGLAATVEATSGSLIPIADLADHRPVAVVSLPPGASTDSPLFRAIGTRHTHRGAYDRGRPIAAGALDEMCALVAGEPGVRLLLLQDNPDKTRLGELIIAATAAIITDPEMAADSARWFRFDWDAVQRHRDGVTLDTTGLPPLINAAAKVLPALSPEQADRYWLDGTRDVHVPTAPLLGIVAVEDLYDRTQSLAAGRAWQRLHLWAAANGLAMQPLNQPVELVDRARQTGAAPEMADALAEMMGGDTWRPTFVFRAGYAEHEARLSPRRPVEHVLSL